MGWIGWVGGDRMGLGGVGVGWGWGGAGRGGVMRDGAGWRWDEETARLVVVQVVGRVPRHHYRRGAHRHALHVSRIDHLLAVAHSPILLEEN